MFIVASDLREAQRERLTSFLSIQRVDVTAYTFKAVRAIYVDLFCTPKSSMENCSPRVNRYGGSISKTFIVEDFSEDEFGQWATDEVTGEEGYIDDEGSCFWAWTTTSVPGSPDQSGAKNKRGKDKAKERAKVDQKEPEEDSFVKSKHRHQNCGLEKIVLGGPKENEARKAHRKVMKASGRVDFVLTRQERAQAVILTRTQAEARIKKERARMVLMHNQDSQHLKTLLKRDKAIPGNQTIGIPTLPIVPQLQLQRGTIQGTLHGWCQSLWILPTIRRTWFWILVAHVQLDRERQSEGSRNLRCIMVLRQNSVPCIKFFVFANSETETCLASCIVHFPTTPPFSTRVDVLEKGDVPILLSLPQMQNWCIKLELDPKGARITCPAYGLYSSTVEYSTMGHIVLNLTSLAYPPKLRERSARPTKHVTLTESQKKSAYPARPQELDDDEDDKPVVHSDRTTVSEGEDEDDKPLV